MTARLRLLIAVLLGALLALTTIVPSQADTSDSKLVLVLDSSGSMK